MDLVVNVGISNRHIHLTKETYNELFDEELTIKNELAQPGEFASNQTVIIKGLKTEIYNVRVLGPFRDYDQVEISNKDARDLGLNPPVRKSGDLANSESIVVVGPKGQKLLKDACIISNRHLHISPEEASSLGLADDQLIKIKIDGPKSGLVDGYIKIQDNSITELHLDTDDANAFQLSNKEKVVIKL